MSSEEVSQQSLRALVPFFEFRWGHPLVPYTDRESQEHRGDYQAISNAGAPFNLECKAERKYTGNLFVESWSNRTIGRKGWLENAN
jgi:hypothetical protein